jgi:hypothetical protein
MLGSIVVMALVYGYFWWRMMVRNDHFIDAILFPIRWFCDKTGLWK